MISLIDVMSTLDGRDEPVGHGLKMLRDFPRLFAQKVQIVAGKEYVGALEKGAILPCRNHSGVHKGVDWKVLCNYFISLIIARGSFLVYTITPEALLWGIGLFKGKRKIIAVTYEHWNLYIQNNLADKPLRKALVKRGLSRLDGCIVTNTLYKPKVPYIRIPDYYITDEMKRYSKEDVREGCVCLGEIRYGKDVVGLAQVMGKTDIPLLIAGAFQNRELYLQVKGVRADNVKVENRNLPYGNYLEHLSRCRYVILPYDAEYYDGRTSGVLLEGIFMGAIPVAPMKLLEQNGIQGLGYRNITEIPELISKYEAGEIVVENPLGKYHLGNYRKKIAMLLSKLV